MWGLCDPGGAIAVTVPGSVTAEPPGVVVHRTETLRAGDCGKLRGVPVTSPARTIVDLAGVLAERDVDEILQNAVVAGLLTAADAMRRAAASAGRGQRGPAVVGRLLTESNGRPHLRSRLEDEVAEALEEIGVPFVRELPVYAGAAVYYLDFAFPTALVAVEADGRRWHSDAIAFEGDRRRQNALTAAGWTILRITQAELRADPTGVRNQVRAVLAQRSPSA